MSPGNTTARSTERWDPGWDNERRSDTTSRSMGVDACSGRWRRDNRPGSVSQPHNASRSPGGKGGESCAAVQRVSQRVDNAPDRWGMEGRLDGCLDSSRLCRAPYHVGIYALVPAVFGLRGVGLALPGPLRCPKEVGPCSFVVVTALHQRARDQLGAVVGKPVQPPLSRQVVTVEMETCVRGVACADHPKGIVDHQQYD